MAPLLRLKAMVLSLSILCGCVSSGIGKIAPADRPGMRRITVVEKQTSISPAFSLPSHPVSGALSGGLAGVGTGAYAGIAMCPIGPCAFGMGGFGAVLGLVSGIAIGAACGSAIAEAEIDDPAAQVKRLFETVEVKRFRAAIEARIQYLKPNPVDSMAPSVPDTVLEVTEISITIRQANREPDDSSHVHPGCRVPPNGVRLDMRITNSLGK